jgi:hypothetical protein
MLLALPAQAQDPLPDAAAAELLLPAEEAEPAPIAEEPSVALGEGVDVSVSLLAEPVVEPWYERWVRLLSEQLVFLPDHWRLNGVFLLIVGFLVEVRAWAGKATPAALNRLERLLIRLGILSYQSTLSRLADRLEGEHGNTSPPPPPVASAADLERLDSRIKTKIGVQREYINAMHDEIGRLRELLAEHVDLDERGKSWEKILREDATITAWARKS